MIRFVWQLALVLGVMASGVWLRASAEVARAPLTTDGSIRIVYGADAQFPPFSYLDADGKPTGFNVELIREIARLRGWGLEIRLGPWSSVRRGLEVDGTVDISDMNRTPERETIVEFSDPIVVIYGEIFTRRGAPAVTSLEGMKDLDVIVQQGAPGDEYLTGKGIAARVIRVPSEPDALRLLASGSHDCAIAGKIVGMDTIKRDSLDNLVATGAPLFPGEYGFVTKRGRPGLIHEINAGLATLRKDGTFNRLHNKWLQPEARQASRLLKRLAWIIGALALLTGTVFAWSMVLRRRVAERTALLEAEFTSRLDVERRLAANLSILQGIAAGTTDAVYAKDLQGRYEFINEAGANLVGRKVGEIIGRDDTALFSAETSKAIMAGDRAIIEGGKARTYDETGVAAGVERTYASTKGPWRDQDGRVIGLIGISRDITEGKKAAIAVRESEAKLRTAFLRAEALFENVGIPIMEEDFSDLKTRFGELRASGVRDFDRYFLEDPDRVRECAMRIKITGANKKLLEFYEMSRFEEVATSFEVWFTDASWEVMRQELVALANGADSFVSELPIVSPKGVRKHVILNVHILPDPENSWKRVTVAFVDITEKKKAERDLVTSLQNADAMFEHAAVPIWDEDFSAVKDHIDALVSGGVRDLDAHFRANPDDLKLASSKITVRRANQRSLDFYGVNDFESLLTNVPAWFVDDSWDTFRNELVAFASGKLTFDGEIPVRTPAGEEKHLAINLSILPEGREHWEHVFYSSIDITKIKQAEKDIRELNRSLESRVEERTAELKEVVEELNAFAYSISHDLRAPLRGMQGMSNALIEDYAELLPQPGQDFARRIQQSAQMMDQLIQDLLAYSRLSRGEISLRPVRIDLAVGEVLEIIQPFLEESGAAIEVSVEQADVRAHPVTLVQILTNLITNAVKFVPPGRKPLVRIFTERHEGKVRLIVEDNGIGIDAEYHERIFRVFERLHGSEEYPGTGIGLAIVRKGAERMAGTVGLESLAGRGSRFWIQLPEAVTP